MSGESFFSRWSRAINSTMPARHASVSTVAGEDPDAIDDATEAYMDNDHDEFGTVIVPCHRSHMGQCQYDGNGIRCMYCGRPNE